VFGNRCSFVTRTPRKSFGDALRELLDIPGLEVLTPFLGAHASRLSYVRIRKALVFGAHKSSLLDQHTLSFVPLARTAEPDDYSLERRVLARSPGERRIATLQEHEMVEIGAGETHWPAGVHAKEPPPAELLAALGTHRVADDPEHHDLTWWLDRIRVRVFNRRRH
jgi:hypothetical protein